MPSELEIRVATTADAAAVFDAHQDAVNHGCAAAYSPQHMAAWFVDRTQDIYTPMISAQRLWLAEQHGRVLGFVAADPGEVTLLFVRREATGRGLGKRLLRLGVELSSQGHAGPVTVIATLNSTSFYASEGFVPVETGAFTRGTPALRYDVVKMQRPMA